MKRVTCMAVVGVTLLAVPLPAAAAADQGLIYFNIGAGNDSCGAWTKGREAAGKGIEVQKTQDGIDRVRREQWLQGYITATNVWLLPEDRGAERHLSEGTDQPGIMAWIDNYCAAHPLEQRALAAKALTDELSAKWLAAHSARK